MTTTPKALRKAPPRRFENYVLTRVTSPDVGLVDIPDSMFTPVPGTTGTGYTDDGVSTVLPIGFDFEIDRITYKNFAVSTNGWFVLVDPFLNTFNSFDVLSSAVWINGAIRSSWTQKHVLLAPWFDDLRNVAQFPTQLGLGTPKVTRIQEGLETPPISLNEVSFAVKTYLDVRSPQGRRFICRWSSLSDYATAGTIIKFELVLYENGTIEYRYVPRRNLTLVATANEDATVGIFMPNGTNRFRDFSLGLGYRDGERQQYRYGGAVFTSTYTDSITGDGTTSPYTAGLKPAVHWPGLDGAGAVFVFAPPTNRRKILPRLMVRTEDSRLSLPTVTRTGDPTRMGNRPVRFDDRRSLPYVNVGTNASGILTGALVNYPSTLQRFYGDSEPGVVGRQDLFAGDFEITASVVKTVVEPFIGREPQGYVQPFNENNLFAQDPSSITDPFFSGSSVDQLGDGLSQPLRSKTHIRISLPIEYTTKMFGVSASIYYYNRRANCWEVPQNSSYVITNFGSTNDSGRPRGDIAKASVDSPNGRVLEDLRGFGPLGNVIASGSHTKSGQRDQTDASIGAPYSVQNVSNAINRFYPKSVQSNEEYRATADEVFTLPISQPFLIEKAIIELPMAAGNGWFNDKTTCFEPLESSAGGPSSGSFDFAGPALTLALFNQTVFGRESRRDLVLTGTITHQLDDVSEMVFSNFPSLDSTYQIRPQGFRAFGCRPGGVVSPTSTSLGYQFTGSVAVKCVAQVSNGVIAKFARYMLSGNVNLNRSGVLDTLNTKEISLGDLVTPNLEQQTRIAYINNFGRGATGFEPSGRSAFGKEFVTALNISAQGKIPNPFYLSGGNGAVTFGNLGIADIPAQFKPAIQNGSFFKALAAIPLESHLPSPYLVRPGDTLVLAVSKTRPFFYGTLAPTPNTSGSITHDVTLMTGAINITLYGSLLREGREFHDTLNQLLSSDAVHEIVIGNDPVVDQFETDYRELYVSGTYDDYIAGNMITRVTRPDGRIVFVTGSVIGSTVGTVLSRGSRGRLFSRNNARTAQVPGTSEFDESTSMGYRLQPHHERAGTARVSQFTNTTERFWDTLMPAVNECFLANGAGIFMLRTATIGNPATVDQRLGFIWFDYQLPAWMSTWGKLLDGVWTRAYPYEPRYSHIPRQQFIERSFIANFEVDFFGSYPSYQPGVFTIPPRPLTGFFFGPVGARRPSVPPIEPPNVHPSTITDANYQFHNYLFSCDVDLKSNLTSSAGIADASKALFGFGDMNNMISTSLGTNTTFGTNHYADSRVKYFDPNNWGAWFAPSPLIRGWKYGVYSGLPTFSTAYFRPGRFGQLRDMLEQRPFTKFYQTKENNPGISNFQQGTTPSAVTVTFVDATGKLTRPENTWSQNLSFEATSSVPYFDGETRNRKPINTNTLNSNIIAFKTNQFGQVTL